MTPDTLVTWYLEMSHRAEFIPAFMRLTDAYIALMTPVDLPLYRQLYRVIGEPWMWRDRLPLSDETLTELLQRAHVHILYVDNTPVGYVELARYGQAVSIDYFGLMTKVQGRGLGKHLLSYGIQHAWEMGAERVIVHTCNLDGPYALSTYQKRGFRVVRETQEPMPDLYR